MPTKGFDDRNVIGLFYALYEEVRQNSWASRLSLFNPNSDRGTEEYGIFGGFPGMREWIGPRQLDKAVKKSYSITNRKFESSLPVNEEDLDREKTGLLEAYIADYAEQVPAGHWEDLILELLNTNGPCLDGSNFFSATHQFAEETAQTNELTASECPALNVGTATTPTPEEAARALMQVIGKIQLFQNDKGRLINRNAKGFTVMCSTVAIQSAMLEAIASQTLSSLVSNPLNGLKLAGLDVDVQLEGGYTGVAPTTEFLVFRKDGRLKPFLQQEEQMLTVDMLDRDSEHFKINGQIAILLKARRNTGYGLWQHAARATMS